LSLKKAIEAKIAKGEIIINIFLCLFHSLYIVQHFFCVCPIFNMCSVLYLFLYLIKL
jgi:hypothetical protein